MHNVGVHDFNLKQDLLLPSSSKTIRNLSAIINFAKFREDRLAQYHEHTLQAVRSSIFFLSPTGANNQGS